MRNAEIVVGTGGREGDDRRNGRIPEDVDTGIDRIDAVHHLVRGGKEDIRIEHDARHLAGGRTGLFRIGDLERGGFGTVAKPGVVQPGHGRIEPDLVPSVDGDLTREEALEIELVFHVHATDLDVPKVGAVCLRTRNGRGRRVLVIGMRTCEAAATWQECQGESGQTECPTGLEQRAAIDGAGTRRRDGRIPVAH